MKSLINIAGATLLIASAVYNAYPMTDAEKHQKTAVCLSLQSGGMTVAKPFGKEWELLVVYTSTSCNIDREKEYSKLAKLAGFEYVRIIHSGGVINRKVR